MSVINNSFYDDYYAYQEDGRVHYEQNANRGYSIQIQTKNNTLTLYKGNEVYKTYKVALGKPSTPTPKGNFHIINKAINPGGPFGVRWLGLNVPHYGIHGTNNPSSIGKNVSNGCIRMYNKDVLELSNLVSIRTPVKII